MNLSELKWVEKKPRGGCKKTDDVTIHVSGKKSVGYSVRFYFRNKSVAFIKNSRTLAVSNIVNNRIYFLPDTDKGYAISRPHGKNTTSYAIHFASGEEYARKLINVWEKAFEIRLDEECGLYYIENK